MDEPIHQSSLHLNKELVSSNIRVVSILNASFLAKLKKSCTFESFILVGGHPFWRPNWTTSGDAILLNV